MRPGVAMQLPTPPLLKDDFLRRFKDSAIQLEDGFSVRIKNFIHRNTTTLNGQYRDYERASRVYRLELNSASSQWEVYSKNARDKYSKRTKWALEGTKEAQEKQHARRRSTRLSTGTRSSGHSQPQAAQQQHSVQGEAGPSGVAGPQAQQGSWPQQPPLPPQPQQQQPPPQQQRQKQQQRAEPQGGSNSSTCTNTNTANVSMGSRKRGPEEVQEGDGAEEEAERAEQAVRRMQLLHVPTLAHTLATDPPHGLHLAVSALEQHSRTYQQLGLERSPEWEGASQAGASETALSKLDDVASQGRALLQPSHPAPNLVILAGPPSAGKSSLANQLVMDNLPRDLSRQNLHESGPVLLSGPSCMGNDTSDPEASAEEQGFVYSEDVHLPDLFRFEPDDAKTSYSSPEDENFPLPKGSGSGSVTGAPILIHSVEVPKTKKPSRDSQKFVVELEIQPANEVTSTLKDAQDEEGSGEEGDREGAGNLERARAMFGLEEHEDLPSNPAERKLPQEFKFQKLRFEISALHPDGFKMVHRILKRYTQSGYWGMVKEANVYIPSVRRLPSIMDAPGLAVGEPFRLKLVQDAVRMHPSFALVVMVKSREGSDGLPYNMRELELPGAMQADGSSLSWLPIKACLWYNVVPDKQKKTLRNLLENNNFHGPRAKYRSILPDLISTHAAHDKGLQEAMLKQIDVGPVFLNEESLASTVVDGDLEAVKARGLLLKDLWGSRIMRAHEDAQKMHPLVLMLRDVKPELHTLFEAFEADFGLLVSNSFLRMISKPGMDDLCERLHTVIAKLRAVKSKLLPSKTRAGSERNVPEQLRTRVAQEMGQLLKDCTAHAFDKRVSTGRRVPGHRLNNLVRVGSHQLRVALLTKPSDASMPLSLPELALGDTMFLACNRIRDLAHGLIGRHLAEYYGRVMKDALREEIRRVQTAAKRRLQQLGAESDEWPAVSRAIAVFEQLAAMHLRTLHAETSRELAEDVEWLRPDNEDSALWRLRAYDDAMHEDCKDVKAQSGTSNERRLTKIKQSAPKWGERVVNKILDYFVPRPDVNNSDDSVWCKRRDVMAARSDKALSDLDAFVQGMPSSKPITESSHLALLIQALRTSRLLVTQIMVALEDAAHTPTTPTHTATASTQQPSTNYAALLHRLTSHTGSSSSGDAAQGGEGPSSGQAASGGGGASGSSQASDAGAAALLLTLSSSTPASSTLDRARQLLQQHDVFPPNEARTMQQQQQQVLQHTSADAGQEQSSCSCCKQQEDKRNMFSIEDLLARSSPLRKLAGNQALVCVACYGELNNTLTGSNSDLCDEEAVQEAWSYVINVQDLMVREGWRRARARTAAKRHRAH